MSRWTAVVVVGAALVACGPAPAGEAAAPTFDDWSTCTGPVDETTRVTSPGDDATASAGPLTLVGESAAASVLWQVRDAQGVRVHSGAAEPRSESGTFTVALDLSAGSYRISVLAGDATAATGCDQVAVAVQPSGPGVPLTWPSGVSGAGVVDGQFATWRETPVTATGTWVDDNASQLGLWTLQPDGELGTWTGDVDVAVGAIDADAGESWAAAATGEYDGRWRESLQSMAVLWEGRPGTVSVRFAHEFNGNWYPWSVSAAEVGDFQVAWRRFRALQQELFPASRLVFAPNVATFGQPGLDWRAAFPGAEFVDLTATSFFNAYGFDPIATPDDFWDEALAYDPTGAPEGVQRHLEFAVAVGLPFAVSEWGARGLMGDSPVYFEQMFSFFNSNADRLAYEVLFNMTGDAADFSLFPVTDQPLSAEAYRRLW